MKEGFYFNEFFNRVYLYQGESVEVLILSQRDIFEWVKIAYAAKDFKTKGKSCKNESDKDFLKSLIYLGY